MIATVLVGPGKPKLIQIQRPPSSHSRLPSPTKTTPSPLTPSRGVAEISAFSPYDTPCSASKMNSGSSIAAVAEVEDLSKSSNSLIPPPLSLPSRNRSGSSVGSSTLQQLRGQAGLFDTSPRCPRSHKPSTSTETKTIIDAASKAATSPGCLSPTVKVAAWSRCRKLERALNTVTRAIDTFPDGMLRLDTPALFELRRPHITDQTYIHALQRIFPNASVMLLSALTAWILVDLYFSKLELESTPVLRHWARAANSNENLHQIPEKAQEMLGIGLLDTASIRLNECALRKRAVAVHASVAVIGQRLIEALRGAWDDDIWRSLKVLVEVIEASPAPWG